VIPGDIGRKLGLRASGTWRPAPGGGPGTYASSLPFRLAERTGEGPAEVAARLASALRGTDWISAASVTGGGYLTVTVTERALVDLAVRIPAAGAGCAASDALCGTEVSAPADGDAELAAAADWAQARRLVAGAVTGRLAGAAGAAVRIERAGPGFPRGGAGARIERAEPGSAPDGGAPASAVAFAGADAIRYHLARTMPTGHGDRIEASRGVRNELSNPFFAVRYAHAHAASVLRWAADLGVDRGDQETPRPRWLAHPGERALLALLSWMSERAASSARRGRPDAWARYLESVAGAWLDCAEGRPALAFGGRSAPRDGAEAAARLWLADAARTVLRTGLGLLGVSAPERL
jgi:arginyl-tRNA synthetase